MNKPLLALIPVAALAVFRVACTQSVTETVATNTAPVEAIVAPTTAVPPSATPLPTATPTPMPSATPTSTSTPTITSTPSPTPFGGFVDLRVIVQKEDDGDYFLMDSNGNEMANLTGELEGKKIYRNLSPDDERSLFIISPSKGAPFQFWVKEINDEPPRMLFELAGQDPWAYWSPDSQHFLVIIKPENTTKEWLYFLADLDEGEPIVVHNVCYRTD